jgi:hypothetical protein
MGTLVGVWVRVWVWGHTLHTQTHPHAGLCAQNWIIPDYPYTSARGENQSEFESECEDIILLHTQEKKSEFEFECEVIFFLHTRKNRVSVGLGVRIFCSSTPEKTEWVWVWVCGYFAPPHPRKTSVSVGLSVKKNQIVEKRALKHKKLRQWD